MTDTRQIPLSRGLFATVDAADYEWLSQWKWHVLKVGRPGSPPRFYARRSEKIAGKVVNTLMHRQIMAASKGKPVDHWDRDTLNNTRNNLRGCTHAQNALNRRGNLTGKKTSRYKGVTAHGAKWVAQFRSRYLGIFETEAAAAVAYNMAASAYSPEFAVCNSVPAGG